MRNRLSYLLTVVIGVTAMLLAGCATTAQNKDYAAYLAAAQTAASQPEQPILRIRALPGQTVELRGIEAFEVYAPRAGGSRSAEIAPPPRQEVHPVWGIASQALGVIGNVAGAWLPGYTAGKWMNALAGTVGSANAAIANGGFGALTSVAGSGFASIGQLGVSGLGALTDVAALIQAPQPNVTLSGTGVIGNGTYTGPNSGQNSGNSGTIGNENASPKPTTTTTTTSTTRNCSGGSSGSTGGGGNASC